MAIIEVANHFQTPGRTHFDYGSIYLDYKRMAGILNSKQRLFDTILTIEGRKQIAAGRLKAEFYSFTDAGTHYSQETIISGGLDETYRIQFEATSLPQDTITLEADDSGRLTGFPVSGSTGFIIRGGQILSSSSENKNRVVTGSNFASLSDLLYNGSINNFKNQYILRSPDPLDREGKEFTVGPRTLSYTITDKKPFSEKSISSINVTKAESFFQDRRLSHIPNYTFLPPVNRPRLGEEEATPLGEYVNLNQEPVFTFDDLSVELDQLEMDGYCDKVYFTETSKESNIFGQFFETSQNEMSKLDVIDFGSFPVPGGRDQHVFFVGKVFEDDNGASTFISLFVLVFS